MDKDNVFNLNDSESVKKLSRDRVNKIMALKESFDYSAHYKDKNIIVLVRDRKTGYNSTLLSSNDGVSGLIETLVEILTFEPLEATTKWAKETEMVEEYYNGNFFDRYSVEFIKKFEHGDESFNEYYRRFVESLGADR